MPGDLEGSEKGGFTDGMLDRQCPEGLEGFRPAIALLQELGSHQQGLR